MFVAITFPKILVCSNSMHSRYKLEVFYSQLNATMIEKFYGNYDEINGFKKQEILNLIKLNVSQSESSSHAKISRLRNSTCCERLTGKSSTNLIFRNCFDLRHLGTLCLTVD